jgi:phosphoglycolate phosphatase-like HAD superfamily hydrolase
MPVIKDLIWDLDGTLFDTYPAILRAFQIVFGQYGVLLPDERVLSLARVSFRHCASVIAEERQLDLSQLMERFGRVYHDLPLTMQPPFPGAEELCRWALACGGKNVIVTHRGEATSLRLLDTFGMRNLFAGWVTGDMGYARKPDPQSFLAAIDRFGLRPEVSLALGDRDLDLQAAQAAGVRYTCAYGAGPFSVAADYALSDFHALLILLKENAR